MSYLEELAVVDQHRRDGGGAVAELDLAADDHGLEGQGVGISAEFLGRHLIGVGVAYIGGRGLLLRRGRRRLLLRERGPGASASCARMIVYRVQRRSVRMVFVPPEDMP